ncbi:uncharacterized protein LOC122655884 [Telopea speciosissima]|uniref:uncharacterized protein LOC122655884 n=1 Tax=Telopea speciosissima TaxID=54955 RepID=UPI001CC466A0|nr:uncharacterized protein LOC122655884 [Telopea speciosissima]
MWTSHHLYLPTIPKAWRFPISSCSLPLIAFAKKLRNTKSVLKSWNHSTFGNISSRVFDCRAMLALIQSRLQSDSLNPEVALEEKQLSEDLSSLSSQEENFLPQKSRIKWLDVGDSNLAYFHRSLRARLNSNSITLLLAPIGSPFSSVPEIKTEVISFFSNVFNPSLPRGLIDKFVPPSLAYSLLAIPFDEEISKAFLSHKSHKAPGPDRFSMGFFLSC